jgi:hypothetical protein
MKVTALGVNSAFAVGKYREALPVEDVGELLKIIRSPGFDASLDRELGDWVASKVMRLYEPKWQSNFVIEFKQPGKVRDDVYRLILDFGGDIRHSLAGVGLGIKDCDGFILSHNHSDHNGGTEGIALSTFFNPAYTAKKLAWQGKNPIADLLMHGGMVPEDGKPDLYGHTNVIDELWRATEPGLATLQGIRKVELATYFNVIRMYDNKTELKFRDGDRTWTLYTVVSTHVLSGAGMMPSYGIMLECSDGTKVFMPTDMQYMSPIQIKTYYEYAHVIYQDTETGFRSGVHPHIDDLRSKLEPHLKKRCLLYHYNEEPVVDDGEFLGILRTGDTHEY